MKKIAVLPLILLMTFCMISNINGQASKVEVFSKMPSTLETFLYVDINNLREIDLVNQFWNMTIPYEYTDILNNIDYMYFATESPSKYTNIDDTMNNKDLDIIAVLKGKIDEDQVRETLANQMNITQEVKYNNIEGLIGSDVTWLFIDNETHLISNNDFTQTAVNAYVKDKDTISKKSDLYKAISNMKSNIAQLVFDIGYIGKFNLRAVTGGFIDADDTRFNISTLGVSKSGGNLIFDFSSVVDSSNIAGDLSVSMNNLIDVLKESIANGSSLTEGLPQYLVDEIEIILDNTQFKSTGTKLSTEIEMNESTFFALMSNMINNSTGFTDGFLNELSNQDEEPQDSDNTQNTNEDQNITTYFDNLSIEELKQYKAVIMTDYGDIHLEFFPDVASNHVKNFLNLASSGFYDGTTFHRVIPEFMIQGGDPNTKDDDPSNDGMGGPGYTIDAEFSDISHERGILSMARASDPDSAGSQFFIMQDDAPQLDGKYSVFGRVSEGLGVVDEIAYVERDSRDRPLEDVEMQVRVFIKSDDRTSVDTNNQTHTEDNQNIDTNSTLVSMPRDIPGTIRNNRPIKFKKGKPGGVFVSYGLEGPSTWNDSQCKDYISSSLIYRLQPGLMNINYDTGQWNVFLGDQSKGDEGPGYDIVVDDYQNKMEIIIYLRKDIYWSDDTHMTSDDWVYYWNEIMSNPDIGHNAYNSTIVKDNGKELPIVAKKIDRFTFKYVFPRQIGDPELSISGGVMPKHIIKPVMDAEGEAGLRDMWGVNTPLKDLLVYGPWIPHQFNLGVNIVFVKNEKYFKKDEWNNQLPYLDKYVVDIIPDNDGGLLKFMNRELSEINIPSNEFTNMVDRADDDGYSVWNGGPNTGVLFLTFNLNPNSSRMKGTPQLRWFSDKRFRQALNYLINKEDLINRVLNGLGEPDKGNLHSSSPYFNPDITFPNEYNPREALRIMREELDIRDRDGDGILEDDTGTNITFELLTNTSNEERIQVMHIISSNWNDYGIDVNTKNIDFDSLVQKLISNFDWETMLMGLTGGIWPSSGANVWRSSANLHFWHPYQDEPATEWEAEVDMLFEKARNEPDFHLRKEHWDDMYKILYDQVPYLLIYRKYSFKAIYDEWENVKWDTMSSVGGYYNQYLFKK